MFFGDVSPKTLAASWNASAQPLVNDARVSPWLYDSYEPQNVRIEWELTEILHVSCFFGDVSPKKLVASWNASVQPLVNEARASP